MKLRAVEEGTERVCDAFKHSEFDIKLALQVITDAALHAGILYCKMQVREHESAARDGKRIAAARRKGGASTGRLSEAEKRLVIDEIDRVSSKHDRPRIWAAELVAAQLRTGTFPGIKKSVDYTTKYVANLRAER
ncbi:hypothetical protein [Botrimarina sp.]|uniref:hypothetical protein n=1 Tax=Botrimarina sp. TaxID=2795802 RepID=UPI0032EC1498